MSLETGQGPLPKDILPRVEPGRLSLEEIRLAGNRGTCMGVRATLKAVEQVMDIVPEDRKVYTTNTPVNFPEAFAKYRDRLVSIEGDLSRIEEDDAVLIYAAHGVTQKMRNEVRNRDILAIDTTCRIVLDEQLTVREAAEKGQHVVFIGEEKHPETIGVKGQVDEDQITIVDPDQGIGNITIPDNSLVLAKTTYAPSYTQATIRQIQVINPTVDATRAHSCYAVRNRQIAANQMIESVDFWLVVGDKSSHNSRELKKVGPRRKVPAALITGPEHIDWSWFNEEIRRLGVSSGASVPEEFTQRVLQPFRDLGIPVIELPQAVEEKEDSMFRLPKDDINALKARFSVN